MPTKPRKTATEPAPTPSPASLPFQFPASTQTPAHNVWLAGLGALARAQANAHAEGSKAFEALVKQGLEMQARTQEQWAEAAQRMGAMTTQATSGGGSWDRLGGIFEGRVARALASMGMPSACEITLLKARVDALEQALAKMTGQAGAAPRGRAAAKKPPQG